MTISRTKKSSIMSVCWSLSHIIAVFIGIFDHTYGQLDYDHTVSPWYQEYID